ncbi:GTPase Msp1 [Schizosaccharomyces octosporus yFS286]|uniref:dynamin GTPase n=1 Tax=Schizosaccharomyces octosporus (strain yFS286) TaxID=483514 RepID=S9RAA3_SCHOY|nr:GTPase Msp1 [Schizosaccharomyces octosporus yFS286]EPX71054.1 GTPase Msp1 [Schizosaccharomyces octosporus yFS286]
MRFEQYLSKICFKLGNPARYPRYRTGLRRPNLHFQSPSLLSLSGFHPFRAYSIFKGPGALKGNSLPTVNIPRFLSFSSIPKAIIRSLRLPVAGFSLVAGGVAYVGAQVQRASDYTKDVFDRAFNVVDTAWDKTRGVVNDATSINLPEIHMPGWMEKILRLDEESVEKRRQMQLRKTLEKENQAENESSSSGGDDNPAGVVVGLTGAVASNLTNDDENSYEKLNEDEKQRLAQESKDDRMMIFTKKMIEIRNILHDIQDDNSHITLPSIVVVGSQSSGKSSVLEAIVGHEFLPKGSNMVTRRPIELTLVHSKETTTPYCEFNGFQFGQITDFTKVQQILTDLNMAIPPRQGVNDDPIRLTICASHIPNLSLIDLPGYIQIHSSDQPVDLDDKIASLCDKYIQEPNIILAVCAADVDLANSTALKASRRVDPLGLRTIGVITKMDLIPPEKAVSILRNEHYPLHYGYIGVISKVPQLSMWSRNQNLTDIVSSRERSYFSAHPEFRELPVLPMLGIQNLRKNLIHVLEYTMSKNLQYTADSIRSELDDCSYQYKVQYNDRLLTAESYIAENLDVLKAAFKELSQKLDKNEVRALLKETLNEKILDLLAERYWMDQNILDWTKQSRTVDEHWQYKLDSCVSMLTRMGLGRVSTLQVTELLSKKIEEISKQSPFGEHPGALQYILNATQDILRRRYHNTSEQVENCVKPYKFEVEIDDEEWKASRSEALVLIQKELSLCQAAEEKIKKALGSKRLSQILDFLDSQAKSSEPLPVAHSAILLDQGRLMQYLQMRETILKLRLSTLKSKTCKLKESKYLCPEIFLNAVSNKLINTAVLFINIELLSEFYYQFPRELDQRLIHSLTSDQLASLVDENPRVKSQIQLQRKKQALELALLKINSLAMLERQTDTD